MFQSSAAQPPDPTPEQLAEFNAHRAPEEDAPTASWYTQREIEERVFLIRQSRPEAPLVLLREKHVSWLTRCLHDLPRGYEAFDALQGWSAFWIIHSLDLLGVTIPDEDKQLVVDHLRTFQQPQGGYGGGSMQIAHLASSFSVVMTLCAVGSDDALNSIDRESMLQFLLQMKQADGRFRVSEGGEADVRALYCGVAVASILGFLDGPKGEHLIAGTMEYLADLQAFDGGLGGEPGNEAHGGNTYCGLAALAIVLPYAETKEMKKSVDVEKVLDWAVMRQMRYEGGFQGRTNKLVDSCYSFWVGALFPIIAAITRQKDIASLFDANALQQYVLECCQLEAGGLRDKPYTARDLMHSCYALSGLSIAQHYGQAEVAEGNELRRTNAVFNICTDKFNTAKAFFRDRT